MHYELNPEQNFGRSFTSIFWTAFAILAGIAGGIMVGKLPLAVTATLLAGSIALLLSMFRPDLALYLFFGGVVLMTDAAPRTGGDFFFIPDMDVVKGLPSVLNTFFLLLFCVTAVRQIILEQKPVVPAARALGIYLALLLMALLAGLAKNGISEILRVDFMSMLFPVLCFYLCTALLNSRARIFHLLSVLLVIATIKATILAAYYLEGRGWPYENYKVATMDSADLLVFITLFLIALHLIIRGNLRGLRAGIMGIACVPMLFVIIFSYRRTQWVGLILSLGLLYWGVPKLIRLRILGALVAALVIGGSVMILGGMSTEKVTRIYTRMASVFDSKQDSNFYHLKESQQVLRDLAGTPVLGMGLGGHHSPLGLYENDVVPTNVVHNTFLYIWMKMGLPGLLFFLWAGWCYARRVMHMRRDSPQAESMDLIVPLAASAGLWLAMFLTSPTPWYLHETFLISLFAAMGMSLILQEEAP